MTRVRHNAHRALTGLSIQGDEQAVLVLRDVADTQMAELADPSAKLVQERDQRAIPWYPLYGPTKNGQEWAKRCGIRCRKGKSKWMHEGFLQRVIRAIGAALPGTRFVKGRQLNRVQPDQFALVNQERRAAIQVSVANKAEYEAKCLVRLANHPAIDLALMVATNRQKASAIKKELRVAAAIAEHLSGEEGKAKALLGKILVYDAATFLDGDKEWAALVAGSESEGVGDEVRENMHEQETCKEERCEVVDEEDEEDDNGEKA